MSNTIVSTEEAEIKANEAVNEATEPGKETPEAKVTVEAPQVEAPPVEAPQVEAPQVEVPEGKVEAAPVKSPKVKAAKVSAAKVPADAFSELGLSAEVQRAIAEQDYTKATPIQAVSIPPILDGRDVVGRAETGTGKTAAFALPLLSRIDPNVRRPQVLVLAPTRELAIQVAKAFEGYGKYMSKLNIATVYGGQHYSIQVRQLNKGPQVVVGTPGRIMDHLRRGQLSLEGLTTLVLDEADEMLRMGFADDVEWIMEQAPETRQTLLFSATLPDRLRKVAEKYLSDPEHIRVKSKTLTAATVLQRVCCTKYSEKVPTLARIMESEETGGMIVFVKTRQMSSRLSEELCQRGYRASALNGDMQQNQRERTVERLKSGKLDILVATDVAARGLDVQRITHVINFDYPHDPEAYVHRIGRTGRAGREGHAILLVTPKERHKLRSLEKFTGQPITWMERPTEAAVREVRAKKIIAKIKKTNRKKDLSAERAWIAELLESDDTLTLEDVAAALAAMATRQSAPAGRPFEASQNESPKRGRKHERSFEDRVMRRGFRADSDESSFKSKKNRRKGGERPSGPWTKYRIEVGYKHGVRPGNIVGAITSEASLAGSDIGGIDIQPDFSTIDLPPSLTPEQIKNLQFLKVAGQALGLSRLDSGGSSRPKQPSFARGGKKSRPKNGIKNGAKSAKPKGNKNKKRKAK